MGKLCGKVAIVTGAASGIGKAIVQLFVQEGAMVLASDIQIEKLKQAFNKENHNLILMEQDVANEEDWDRITKKAFAQWGRIDILINNAGISSDVILEKSTVELFTKTININALGNLLGILAVLPYMKANEDICSIVNISSIGGYVGGKGGAIYAMSKGANRMLAKDAAKELAAYKIRVNCIVPGGIETEMTTKYFHENPNSRELSIACAPMGYLGEAEDVAYAALYLASDDAKYVTGSDLVVDGGVTCC